MAETEQVDEGRSIAERVVDVLLKRVLPFPWAVGFGAGAVAFVAGYAAVVAYLFSGIGNTNLPGSTVQKLIRLGFLHYNGHGIVVVADAPPTTVVPPINFLSNAALPIMYQAIPVLALVGASMLFTYWLRPADRSFGVAVLTGLSMTIGYLLLALVGTFLFSRAETQAMPTGETVTVVLHPDRVQTLMYGIAYPLVLGTFGSIPAQAALTNERESVESTADED